MDSRGICHSGDSSLKVDGTTTHCVTGGDDRIALYISTATAGSAGDAFRPPQSIGDTKFGINLSNALVVGGAASGTFLIDTAGQVCDTAAVGCDGSLGDGNECRLEGATFNFTD